MSGLAVAFLPHRLQPAASPLTLSPWRHYMQTGQQPPMDILTPTEKEIIDEKIMALAERCLKDSGDCIHVATEIMSKKILNNNTLFLMMMRPLVHAACYDTLRRIFKKERKAIWTAKNYTKAGNGHRLLSMLDFPLPHNLMRLGDARKEDLYAAANWYQLRIDDMKAKATWFIRVAEKIGNKRVRQCLSDSQLRELQEGITH